jgi:hypothetical protein
MGETGDFTAVGSEDIAIGLSTPGRQARYGVYYGCEVDHSLAVA